ncbi:MAG: hypothetical protein ACFFG0_00655 [Candidatus Thorarchaeota archaeon]
MDEKLKIALTELFDQLSIELSKNGSIPSTYFMIKEKTITKISNVGLEYNMYSNFVKKFAEKENVDGLILISERNVVSGGKNDNDMKSLINKRIKSKDHPNVKPYLVLMYMSADGENQALFGEIEQDPSGNKFTKNHEWAADITVSTI